MEEKRRRTYRLPPCPPYDVEGMESWLTDLGQEGLFLVEDGFFGGIAIFERGEPRWVKYRLEAAQNSSSIWARNGGEPDPEQVELGRKYGWEYVARRGDFFIYRSYGPGTRELNTDPEVRALALNGVKKRQIRGLVFYGLLMLLILSLILHEGVMITLVTAEPWELFYYGLTMAWGGAAAVSTVIQLRRLQQKLRRGEGLPGKDWRQGKTSYYVKWGLSTVLLCVVIVAFVGIKIYDLSGQKWNGDEVPLRSYTGEVPFATLRGLAENEGWGYQTEMEGMAMANVIQEGRGLLGLRNVDYNEYGILTLPDGSRMGGGLYILYHETVSPWVARGVAEDYERIDRRKEEYAPLELPDLGVDLDYGTAYRGTLGFPTVVLQKENVVIHVFFHQMDPEEELDLAVWAGPIARSIAGA